VVGGDVRVGTFETCRGDLTMSVHRGKKWPTDCQNDAIDPDLALDASMDRSCVVRSQTGYENLLSFARLFGLEAAVAGSDDY
jgi:hypothetical protein